MNAIDQLASPSTLQKYGFYWRTLFANPRGLLGETAGDLAAIKPSDAIVFSVFNLTLAVVLQDRILFSINALSPEAVITKVAVYVLFSLLYWLLTSFAFEKGRTAAWVAGLTASSASCAVATMTCSTALIVAIVLGNLGVGYPALALDHDYSWANEGAISIRVGDQVVDPWLAYHVVLIVSAIAIGVPTIARIAKAPFSATIFFILLFGMFVAWSFAVSRPMGDAPFGGPALLQEFEAPPMMAPPP